MLTLHIFNTGGRDCCCLSKKWFSLYFPKSECPVLALYVALDVKHKTMFPSFPCNFVWLSVQVLDNES